jgi:aquaglyceroporin related protein
MFHKERPEEQWNDSEHLATLPTAHSNGTDHAPHALHSTRTSRKMTGVRTALGLHPLAPIDETHDAAPHQDLLWSKIRLMLREPFSEFLGTMILVLFGNGSVAQVLLSTGVTSAPGGNGFGPYQSISWAWGLGTVCVRPSLHILQLTIAYRCSVYTLPAIVVPT